MKLLVYSAKGFEKVPLQQASKENIEIVFVTDSLNEQSAKLASGYEAITIFAGDDASTPVLKKLHENGVRYITVRAAGYDNVDVNAAKKLGIRVANVPAYSPYAIAEHGVALMLALNRKLLIADKQVRNNNFTVDHLFGFDVNGKNVGIVGTGKIGCVAAKIYHGFGCKIIANDICKDASLEQSCEVNYVALEELCAVSDIITLHACLTPETKHLINKDNIGLMKKSVILINTSRGAVVNTSDIIDALEGRRIGGYGADVYENEKGVFFYDFSQKDFHDPMLEKLLSIPNVIITPHQAFATHEAIENIAATTFENLCYWMQGQPSPNELT